jgi:GT2 family glycosyltransferase
MLHIVIVNWNAGVLLLECLNSLYNSNLDDIDYHVYIVDNNSIDNSIELINDLSKNQTILNNPDNIGFGCACNIVLENYPSEYVLFLNPDVIVNGNSIKESLLFLKCNLNVDVIGVKNYNSDGKVAPSCARFPTVGRLINDILGLSKIAPKIFKPGTIMSDWDHKNSREVDHVIGAFMMVRYSTLLRSGFYDKDYFLYMEDLDLSLRIKKTGGLIFYNADISILHEGGGTTKNIRATSLSYSLQSRLLYCRKHFNVLQYNLICFLSITIEPLVRVLKILFSLNFRDLKPLFIAYFGYFKYVFKKD